MSVTITIEGNTKHCDDNGLFTEVIEPADDQYPEMKFREYPFEINICNGNFFPLFGAMGLANSGEDCCGQVTGERLISALNSIRHRLSSFVRAEESDTTPGRASFFYGGVTKEQVTRYYFTLSQIANEAIRRGKPVIWH